MTNFSPTLNRTAWCKAKEFGCECGRPDTEPCPLPHPGAGLVTTTSTWTDIVDELRDASHAHGAITMDIRFTLVDAAEYIEILRRKLEKAERPWWRRLWD